MKKNDFLSAPKIVKKLVENYNFFNIIETTVQRFLNEEEFSRKEPIAGINIRWRRDWPLKIVSIKFKQS